MRWLGKPNSPALKTRNQLNVQKDSTFDYEPRSVARNAPR